MDSLMAPESLTALLYSLNRMARLYEMVESRAPLAPTGLVRHATAELYRPIPFTVGPWYASEFAAFPVR